jgi:hypothetical protein
VISPAAYFRSGGFDQPTGGGVVQEYEGKLYVVLSNVRGTLAVYRVRNDVMLKGKREISISPANRDRFPAAVDKLTRTGTKLDLT